MANAALIALVLLLSGTAPLAVGPKALRGAIPRQPRACPRPAALRPVGFTIDQKGVKRTGGPATVPGATVTPGGVAPAQSGRLSTMPDSSAAQRGSGSNSKPHTNAGDGDRAEQDASANRGKPTKEQKTYNESRSNTTRMPAAAPAPSGTAMVDDAAAQQARRINTSKSNLRTGSTVTETGSKPTPPEAAPGSTSSIFKN